MLMLVDRATGKGVGITLFDSEQAMQRGDEALNAMSPGAGERRTSVEFFEVPVRRSADRIGWPSRRLEVVHVLEPQRQLRSRPVRVS